MRRTRPRRSPCRSRSPAKRAARRTAVFDVSGARINPFNGQFEADALQPITFTAQEANASAYAWDFGDETTASTRSFVKTFGASGSFTVKLTVTGDGTNTSGTASGSKKFSIGAPQFSAVVVPDASAIVTADGAWKTDVSVTNSGPSTLTISPIYRSYESLVPVPPSTGIDVTALGFDSVTKYEIAPGGTWSQADVVGFLGGTGKGNLFFKVEGGPPPEVAARVYFAPTDPELGAYGNAIAAFQVGAFGQVGVQQARSVTEQTILGVRSDEAFRFKVKLYNSSGEPGLFRLHAFDETGSPVSLLNDGAPVESLDFPIGAYQAAEVSDERIGLVDPAHRYVLKAEPVGNGAMLLATVSIIDRTTNDQIQVADDATRPSPESGAVRVYVPGVSRYDTAISHWRTSVSILNSASVSRGVLVEYVYGPSLVAQSLYTIEAGKLISFDDIAQIFPTVPEIADATGTAGLLKVSYAADAETSTAPLLVSARAYDDRTATSGGTAGTALSSFSGGDAIAVGDSGHRHSGRRDQRPLPHQRRRLRPGRRGHGRPGHGRGQGRQRGRFGGRRPEQPGPGRALAPVPDRADPGPSGRARQPAGGGHLRRAHRGLRHQHRPEERRHHLHQGNALAVRRAPSGAPGGDESQIGPVCRGRAFV